MMINVITFTGEVDDEIDMEQDRDWYDYWRILFKKVEVKDIQEFEDKYKGKNIFLGLPLGARKDVMDSRQPNVRFK